LGEWVPDLGGGLKGLQKTTPYQYGGWSRITHKGLQRRRGATGKEGCNIWIVHKKLYEWGEKGNGRKVTGGRTRNMLLPGGENCSRLEEVDWENSLIWNPGSRFGGDFNERESHCPFLGATTGGERKHK